VMGRNVITKKALTLENFNNGELGLETFRIGEVGKVAYCLFMMYE
jgi:hypothetical protein